MRKSPHVVGHYAAGARLIGLTEKQIAKRLATLNVTRGKDNDSPYAQPLCLFTTGIPTGVLGSKRRTNGKIRLTIRKMGNEDSAGNEQGEEGAEPSSSQMGPLPDVSATLYTQLMTLLFSLSDVFAQSLSHVVFLW